MAIDNLTNVGAATLVGTQNDTKSATDATDLTSTTKETLAGNAGAVIDATVCRVSGTTPLGSDVPAVEGSGGPIPKPALLGPPINVGAPDGSEGGSSTTIPARYLQPFGLERRWPWDRPEGNPDVNPAG